MENEITDLARPLALLRDQLEAHRQIGQDQFFGLRRRMIRAEGRLYSVIEWYNALGGEKGLLIRVRLEHEDAVIMVLHAEMAKLRAALPKAFQAPGKVQARGASS